MAKLSLNKAAIYASVAKSTILEALKSNDLDRKLSGEKNAKGHWQIDTSELDRVFPKSGSDQLGEPVIDPLSTTEKTSGANALSVEVKLLQLSIRAPSQLRKGNTSHSRSSFKELVQDSI